MRNAKLYPLTAEQLLAWKTQQANPQSVKLHLVNVVEITGAIDANILTQAISEVFREAVPLRAVFIETPAGVRQQIADDWEIDCPLYDFRNLEDPRREAHLAGRTFGRVPMPLCERSSRFALYRTGDESYQLVWSAHHIVLDGVAGVLVVNRIAEVYSAIAAGTPTPPSYFGSLQDLLDNAAAYQRSAEYAADRQYWTHLLPRRKTPYVARTPAADDGDFCRQSGPVDMDTAAFERTRDLSRGLGVRTSAMMAAASALLLQKWCDYGSGLILDFQVARRVTANSMVIPALMTGAVPLVLQTSPTMTVADFCRHTDIRIKEAVQHQRFPVHTLIDDYHLGIRESTVSKLAVNILPRPAFRRFGSATATGICLSFGGVDGFEMLFSGDGNGMRLYIQGELDPSSEAREAATFSRHLQHLLNAIVADPQRTLASLDVFACR